MAAQTTARWAVKLNEDAGMAKILWIIVGVLVALWLAGTVIGFVGDIIHFVLVVAIALAIFAFVKRKV